MRLPRLLPFKREKREAALPPPGDDGLALAREQAMARMRARYDATPEAPPAEAPLALEAAPADPTASLAAEPAAAPPTADPLLDPLAPAGAGGDAPAGEDDPLAAAAEAAGAEEALDPDLLDIFRDAKQEAEDGTLVSELEDVPISDLLMDLRSITQRLGVRPTHRAEPESPAPTPEAPAAVPEAVFEALEEAPAATSPVLEAEAPADAGIGALFEPAISPDVAPDEDAPGPSPEVVEEPAVDDGAIDALLGGGSSLGSEGPPPEPVAAEEEASLAPEPPGRRYILHVLFFGLALSMAAGLGVRGTGAGALAEEFAAAPTPAVLAFIQTPLIPETEAVAQTPKPSPSPTASPLPSPSPSPSPSPTPAPVTYTVRGPAYFLYTVQYGDSLSSIASSFDMCPDHILWNNPGRKEEDPLLVGDKLLLPGVRGIIHRVQPWDTVPGIAALYSVRPESIVGVAANHLAPGQEPTANTRLLVPDGIPPSALLRDEEEQELTHTPSQWGYVWPHYGQITTYYGEERPGYLHNAIDIGGLGSYGAPVGASAEGTVAAAVRNDRALGNFVTVQHQDGSRTVYAHLSELYVELGQSVDAAEPVGALGCTGHSTGTHLHFELWIGGQAADPLEYLP
jgi:murein DD-endopeptidase MepM/ murein hydrolase activator NlpD